MRSGWVTESLGTRAGVQLGGGVLASCSQGVTTQRNNKNQSMEFALLVFGLLWSSTSPLSSLSSTLEQ